MSDDHIKRFNLSEAQPHRAFRLNANLSTVKTKDNAKPVMPPPRVAFIPHPQLAPPGMMGSRLAKEAAEWKAKAAPDPAEKRTFKPFQPRTSTMGAIGSETII